MSMLAQKVLRRRDSTVFHVPTYPQSIHGAHLRSTLRRLGKCAEVTENEFAWHIWTSKLVKEKYLMRTADGHYARPRTPADLAHAYRRSQPRPIPKGQTLAEQLRLVLAEQRQQLTL